MILTWLVAIPALGGLLAWVVARRSALAARYVALAACAAIVAGSAWARLASPPPEAGPFFVEHDLPWIVPLGARFHLGMDGLSLLLVALTGLLGMVAVSASFREIETRVGTFHFLLLVLLSGIVGVFLALDLFLFFFFWELMLVPMYFLIAIWGHENRTYAAVKFFLFTFAGGLAMLAAILVLHFSAAAATGVSSFDLSDLAGVDLEPTVALWAMLGFFVAFGVKLPALPVHSWLPDAHTEAPTAGSVILAGIMLKTGAYGLIRFAIPLFPGPSRSIAEVARALAVAGIVYGALMAFPQRDMKRLVAYTSVSHLGFVLLGIYAGSDIALAGAVMGMVSHALATGALFVIVGILQERTGTRELDRLGGLQAVAPRLGGFTMLFAQAALGLPTLASFVAEILVLFGTFDVSPALTVVAATGLVLSVVYSLRLVQDSMHGENVHRLAFPDLGTRETVTLGLLAVLVVWLGLRPQAVLDAGRGSFGPVTRALAAAPLSARGGGP